MLARLVMTTGRAVRAYELNIIDVVYDYFKDGSIFPC